MLTWRLVIAFVLQFVITVSCWAYNEACTVCWHTLSTLNLTNKWNKRATSKAQSWFFCCNLLLKMTSQRGLLGIISTGEKPSLLAGSQKKTGWLWTNLDGVKSPYRRKRHGKWPIYCLWMVLIKWAKVFSVGALEHDRLTDTPLTTSISLCTGHFPAILVGSLTEAKDTSTEF